MNNSPFEIFRKNLKPMMVVLVFLAMIAFVVLPALQTYMQRNMGTGTDSRLASFDGVELKQSRVDNFTRNHASIVRFLRELAEETIARGGTPRTPGFAYDTQTRQVQSIGIDSNPSQLASIRTLQYSAQATDLGFELDDTAISTWLSRYTDATMSDGEIIALLMQSTRNQMGKFHLYDQLRHQLLAELYQRGALAGVVDGQLPIVTPVEQWENFLKLNQQATANAYAVMVQDYIDKTNKNPSAAEIRAVYEAGKDLYPSDQSPEPGFRRRETASFEYLVANLQSFIDREVAQMSEETLRAEYERRLAGGDFKLPEESNSDANAREAAPDASGDVAPEMPATETPATETPATETPATETPATETPATETPATETPATETPATETPATETPATETPATETPATETPATETPATETPATETPATETPATETPATETPATETPATETPATETPATEDESSWMSAESATRLVAFQDDEAETAETQADEPVETSTSDEDKPAEKTPAGAEEAPMSEEKPAGDQAGAEEKPAEKPEPKIESFEEVKDRIADELAGPVARQKLGAAINEATTIMRKYFNEKSIYESDLKIGKKVTAPKRPDFKALARSLGMDTKQIGPLDEISVSSELIADSYEVGTEQFQRGPSFAVMMFGVRNGQSFIPKQQLFSPLQTADDQTGKSYVSWKTDETEAYTPSLDEAREEVIMAIRTQEARKLAREAAESIAKKVNEAGDKPLAESIPADKKDFLFEDLGPFSWMNSFGFGRASIGNVPQLDSVGSQFMREVFTSEIGEAGVAPNQPERVFYVVRPTGFQPPIDELKRRFLQPQERMMAMLLGNEDAGAIVRGFYKSVDDAMGFEYDAPEAE